MASCKRNDRQNGSSPASGCLCLRGGLLQKGVDGIDQRIGDQAILPRTAADVQPAIQFREERYGGVLLDGDGRQVEQGGITCGVGRAGAARRRAAAADAVEAARSPQPLAAVGEERLRHVLQALARLVAQSGVPGVRVDGHRERRRRSRRRKTRRGRRSVARAFRREHGPEPGFRRAQVAGDGLEQRQGEARLRIGIRAAHLAGEEVARPGEQIVAGQLRQEPVPRAREFQDGGQVGAQRVHSFGGLVVVQQRLDQRELVRVAGFRLREQRLVAGHFGAVLLLGRQSHQLAQQRAVPGPGGEGLGEFAPRRAEVERLLVDGREIKRVPPAVGLRLLEVLETSRSIRRAGCRRW